jgi:glycosyltransferase involved in cell wall biosynthesis
MRKIAAARTRKKHRDVWPINEAAGGTPPGWPGWPDDTKFAIVLTHDVEGPEGLAKCRQLAEMEMSFGLRSCFNFIPEGRYVVPPDLRSWLTTNGFEVGVHDLKHDGKLYRSRRGFIDKAQRINRYIKEWKAVGFRSGFMLRELDWIHDLDILYDASTFDTDPFEPQPEGAGTIFPYWIASSTASHRSGYVELPYTLPQDSTLFLLLGERSADIWRRKLDWVAGRGGMAMVNVHPDYLCFEGERQSSKTYPVARYAELLQHITAHHGRAGVNYLPIQVANHVRAALAGRSARITLEPAQVDPPILRRKRAAVLLYSDYPADPRPRRAAQSMFEAGMEVDVFCLSEADDEPLEEFVAGVHVFRLKMKRRRDRVGNYVWLYGRFITASFWFLLRRSFGRRYDVVHVHNMPDILVFAAAIPKLYGARVILDLHDPMPELMTTIFGVDDRSMKIRLLKSLEKLSLTFADAVITVNRTCRNIFSARSCPPEKIHVVMNSPDETIFADRAVSSSPDRKKFILMYHGSLVERHGLDLAVQAVDKLRHSIPGIELRIYGKRTPFLDKVLATVQTPELADVVRYLGVQDLEHIAEAIRQADIGIIPNRRSVFTELNTPTRIFEYLSQSKPVIAPRAQGILDYFGPNDLVYFELGDASDLAEKILFAYHKPDEIASTVRSGRQIYLNHCWAQERRRFLELTATLVTPRAG